jgi:hypothetical protein
MIAISLHKDKKHHTWQMRVMDAGDNSTREILRGGGGTPREAALWLLRNVNKLADEVEEQLVELGFLTEAECDGLAEADVDAGTKDGADGKEQQA